MPSDDAVRNVCRQLIDSQNEDEIRVLGDQLRRLLHESIESARSQARVLPSLDEAPKRKKAS